MLASISPEHTAAYRYGGLTLFLALAAIITALGFEYLGGYAPCPLCLMQRYAYYAGIPLLFVAMALVEEKPRLSGLIFFVVALGFLANAGLSVYHAGAEWKFWPGPETCATAQELPRTAADLLRGLEQQRVIQCDEASWRFAGLSFAGWNVIISLVAFSGAIKAAFLAATSRS